MKRVNLFLLTDCNLFWQFINIHPSVCIFVSLLCLWHCKQLPLRFRHSPSGPFLPPPPLVGRYARHWQIGSVCSSSSYGRCSMCLPANAVRNVSSHYKMWGKRGRELTHKQAVASHALLRVCGSCLVSSCFFVIVFPLWTLLDDLSRSLCHPN